MSTDQEYWDACLIKTWRNAKRLLDAMIMFKSITGKHLEDIQPPLLRVPRVGYQYKLPVRIFMANHLEKISNLLFKYPPEKDVLLLRKLKDSKYNTSDKSTQATDKDLKNAMAKNQRDTKRVAFFKEAFGFDNRNRSTDWNVTK